AREDARPRPARRRRLPDSMEGRRRGRARPGARRLLGEARRGRPHVHAQDRVPALRGWRQKLLVVAGVATLFAAASGRAQPGPAREGDVVLRDFRFGTGETLPALRMHYLALGAPA